MERRKLTILAKIGLISMFGYLINKHLVPDYPYQDFISGLFLAVEIIIAGHIVISVHDKKW